MLASYSYTQTTGSVDGKILDGELYNEPLLMATVSLQNTDLSVQSNFNGNFEITDIAPGSYTLLVRFLGYEDLVLPVSIKEGESTYIQCSLKAKTLKPIDFAEVTTPSKTEKATSSGMEQ